MMFEAMFNWLLDLIIRRAGQGRVLRRLAAVYTDDSYDQYIARAREMYAEEDDEDVEIDDFPLISDAHADGDDGVWVSGWFWVADSDAGVGGDDDDESGDDLCDICCRSGRAVYRTTFAGQTVCGDPACQDEADRLDALDEEE